MDSEALAVLERELEPLDFNEEKHEYKLRGEKLPGVTTILRRCGIIDTKFYTDDGAENGKRRHYLTELYDRGTLDWNTVLDIDLPFIGAWISFMDDFKAEILAIEMKIFHKVLLFAGQLDRLCIIDGKVYILDIKSGASQKWHDLQLILYADAFKSLCGIEPGLMVVYLKKNGKYSYEEYTYKNRIYALSAVRVDRWKKLNGKKLEG